MQDDDTRTARGRPTARAGRRRKGGSSLLPDGFRHRAEDGAAHRTRFPASGLLALGLAAGLAACGGGSPPSGIVQAPPGSGAPEMTITPSANRAPEPVEPVPAQELTEGGAAVSMDVAAYFRDPDGDTLTYSARSGDPGILTVGMSGSTLTLTPGSDGTATVTVTAGDGEARAVQDIVTRVRQLQSASPPAVSSPSPPPPPLPEPVTRLTGIKLEIRGGTTVVMKPVPPDARLAGVSFAWVPFEAGRISFAVDGDDGMWFNFFCKQVPRFTGQVEIEGRAENPDGGRFSKQVTANCY